MSTTTLKSDLLAEIDRLTIPQQQRLLNVARGMTPGEGIPVARLLSFAGTIPKEDLQEIAAAIEDGCERVDADAW
jgi:hypothetical protein